MKTCGLFTTHRFLASPILSNRPIKLIFFGDVHRCSPNCAEDAWKDFLRYAKRQRNAIFLGMGDYLDAFSTSERILLTKDAGMHDSSIRTIETMQQGQVMLLAKELAFMKGRIVGLLGGNHYSQFQDSTNSDQRLARELDCRFLGVSSFIRLTLARNGGGCRNSVDIWAHHGKAGGKLLGTSINQISDMMNHAEADIYAMGHDHNRAVIPAKPRLRLRDVRAMKTHADDLLVEDRQSWLCRTGSFLKAYEPGVADYNVDAARGPCSLGWVELELTMRREVRGGEEKTWLQIRGVN